MTTALEWVEMFIPYTYSLGQELNVKLKVT